MWSSLWPSIDMFLPFRLLEIDVDDVKSSKSIANGNVCVCTIHQSKSIKRESKEIK